MGEDQVYVVEKNREGDGDSVKLYSPSNDTMMNTKQSDTIGPDKLMLAIKALLNCSATDNIL